MAPKAKTKKAKRKKKTAARKPAAPAVVGGSETKELSDEDIASTNRGEVKHEATGDVSSRYETFPQELKDLDLSYGSHDFNNEWPGEKIFIGFPCHKQTNAATTWSLVATAQDLGKHKCQMDLAMGDGIIANARNRLAHRFLSTKSEWMIWLDDDMIPPIGRPEWFNWIGNNDLDPSIGKVHYVGQLLSHGKTLVGACYFGRQISGLPVFNQGRVSPEVLKMSRAPLKLRSGDTLVPTEWTGTGCLAVHRSVYEDIKVKFPELAPTDNSPFWNFFHPRIGLGEDVSFCLRAGEAGHPCFTDLAVQCLHVGYCAYGFHNTFGVVGQTKEQMI